MPNVGGNTTTKLPHVPSQSEQPLTRQVSGSPPALGPPGGHWDGLPIPGTHHKAPQHVGDCKVRGRRGWPGAGASQAGGHEPGAWLGGLLHLLRHQPSHLQTGADGRPWPAGPGRFKSAPPNISGALVGPLGQCPALPACTRAPWGHFHTQEPCLPLESHPAAQRWGPCEEVETRG